ncbi:MAG: hypothetical protein JO325_24625 [Solirubrobacterales bacterium]|nr:hypothetical protein [Solirubrobacterales bacterium]
MSRNVHANVGKIYDSLTAAAALYAAESAASTELRENGSEIVSRVALPATT